MKISDDLTSQKSPKSVVATGSIQYENCDDFTT